MQRAALLLEAFVPGLGSLSAARHDEVQREIVAVLPPGQAALLIAIPDDEVLLVLTWQDDNTADLPNGAPVVEALAHSRIGAIVQRIVHAWVLR